jgi:predicted site-specific integrase-resolvase
MTKRLTPAQAAKKAGVSRSTISRALKNSELFGVRGNNSRWTIAETDLENWSVNSVQTSVQTRSSGPSKELGEQLFKLSSELSVQSVKIEMLEAQVADLKLDRDEWRAMAKRRWWHRR